MGRSDEKKTGLQQPPTPSPSKNKTKQKQPNYIPNPEVRKAREKEKKYIDKLIFLICTLFITNICLTIFTKTIDDSK